MNKYLNPVNYARRTLALANRHLLGHVESGLAPDPHGPLRHPPIFFLGAPRSGSTLAVQIITDALDVGYISNRHCQWFGAPALAEKLFHPSRNRPTSDYRSRHGVTDGWHAPAECGEWWYRFFRRRPPYVRLDEVDPDKMRAFRRSVASLTNAFDRPIVFKNLYASLRIQGIAQYLPESLFIVTHRDEVDNGHSLLETRQRVFGDYQTWWSMEPPETEALKKLPPHEQVIEQIRHIHAVIETDLAGAGVSESRRFDLTFEKFCSSPAELIGELELFFVRNGCTVQRLTNPPEKFEPRKIVRIDKALYSAMEHYANRA
ncbi:hypothetical protein Thimo_0029 [Thioflavicoccus mobilis 8321]|uniref:Sulfotransferase family protein n=1 Tax=Thioflavicoccus mobilis 8321 TaxID=765912 RepID=L0GSD4_9GAMM|nr:sulfotransferase [Thioflavicoccus mobilis]AGA88906.1 hypothetical protein Thimo_0029 [Thioflavicoccus mobilis 8321]